MMLARAADEREAARRAVTGAARGAAEDSEARGLDGKWVITFQSTTIQPPLQQMPNRALRERIFTASILRARGGASHNTGIVARMVGLRYKTGEPLPKPLRARPSGRARPRCYPASVGSLAFSQPAMPSGITNTSV